MMLLTLKKVTEGISLLSRKKGYEMFSLMPGMSADVCAKCGKALEAPTRRQGC